MRPSLQGPRAEEPSTLRWGSVDPLKDRSGSKAASTAPQRHFRFAPINGHQPTGAAGPFRANNGSRAYSIISSQRASIFLRWSFGQPGLPQSFFVSQEVFGTPKGPTHVFESGNT